jgi:GDP-mannose 6-dehydrogenase
MNVSIFGMGCVGLVTSACLARNGHRIIGVDIDAERVQQVAQGLSPISEPGLAGLLAVTHHEGRLSATRSAEDAIRESSVSLICVGTPPQADGAPDLQSLHACCAQIGAAVRAKGEAQVVILCSTVLPGTTEECAKRLQEAAGDVSVYTAFSPEFLREGCAIADFDAPPFIIAGTHDVRADAMLRDLYASSPAPFIKTEPRTAEIIKYVCNAWHANKVVFANEVGRVSERLGLDAREVMGIVCRDTKLNISNAYMMPGFAYGGSCLPKDVSALLHFGEHNEVALPLLNSLTHSNSAHIDWALAEVKAAGKKRVGLLGLAFKAGTDDLRGSPALILVERLLSNGYDVQILDPCIRPSNMSTANRKLLENDHPQILPQLKENTSDIIAHAEVMVLTQGASALADVIAKTQREVRLIDLTRAFLRTTRAHS